ncbi:MAG TPA: acyl carrier protein, partial [Clostridia bacterium]
AMSNIIEKIIAILVEVKENPDAKENYTENSKIIEDIGLDSLEMINFVLRIEDEFSIEINFDEFNFSDMDDVKTFASFVEDRIESQNKDGVPV